MFDTKFLDELAARIGDAVRASPAKDLEKNVRALLGTLFNKILVGTGDLAQVSQMPVERCIVLDRISSNCRHNYVATVARVARNGEGPRLGRITSIGALGPRRERED